MVQGDAPTEFVDNDLDFAPPNKDSVDPPLVDTPPPVKDAPVESTDEGICRSMRVHMQPKPFIPAYGGKKYAYAITALGSKMLEDVEYCYSQSVAFSFMQQLSLKAALREWGSNATIAGEKEINQLHWREKFIPR